MIKWLAFALLLAGCGRALEAAPPDAGPPDALDAAGPPPPDLWTAGCAAWGDLRYDGSPCP